MKVNLTLLKMIIQLLIILIMIVMLFIISVLLYSTRYWPDLYNYINANITIKRIPKISEFNVTVLEESDIYTTTSINDYNDISTTDTFDDDYLTFDDVEKRNKREIIIENINDYNELPKKEIIVDYVFELEDEKAIIKDLIDESKLTTNMNDVEIIAKDMIIIKKLLKMTTLDGND